MRHVAPSLFLGGIAGLLSSLGALGGCNDGGEDLSISRAGAGGATAGSSGAGGSMGGSGGAGSGTGGSATGGSATGDSATGGGGSGGNAGSAGMGATCTPVFLDAGVLPDTDTGADAGDAGPGVGNGPVGFAADVYPILQAQCGPCHTTDYSGGHNVASSDEVEAYGFAQSLGGRVLARVNGGGMPPTCSGAAGDPGCLSRVDVDLIRRWTAQCFPP